MGVPQFLAMVLDQAGRSVDLRLFAEGIQDSNDNSQRRRPLRVGVDVSSWIYKAAQGLGDMLADERHLSNYGRATLAFPAAEPETQQLLSPTTQVQGTAQPVQPALDSENVQRYIAACTKHVLERLQLLHNKSQADLLIVLDGATPPIKRKEVATRATKRKEAEQQRDEPVDMTGDEEAQQERLKGFRRAGAGQHYSTIVNHLLQALRVNHIPFLVSPYEADGQLAYLRSLALIDLIVTEDSDLVAHEGASPILFKVSNALGDDGLPRGKLLRQEDWSGVVNSLNLTGMTSTMLAVMFVCAGCDYCPKLRGIGIVTACNIVRLAFLERVIATDGPAKPALRVVFDKLYQHTYEPKEVLTKAFKHKFENDFMSGLLMFRHPIVYDPIQGKCITVGDPGVQGGDPELITYHPYAEFCQDAERRSAVAGPVFGPVLSTLIAEGWVSPRTLEPREGLELPPYILEVLQKHAAAQDAPTQEDNDDDEEPETQDELETQQI